ncbi:MAG: host attachment protein [Parachlamydiaceae bacterium]
MQTKHHPITWVLVADNCRAKVYRLLKFPKIEEISFMEHPESGFHNQDLISSRPGSSSQHGGTHGHSYQPETSPKKLEAEHFAVYLANFLSTAKQKEEFHRLYVFAEPSFLGLLRQHMSPEIQKTIVAEVAKELTSFDVAAIEHHLTEY